MHKIHQSGWSEPKNCITSTGTNKMRKTNALYLKTQRLIAETPRDTQRHKQRHRETHAETQTETHRHSDIDTHT